MIILSMNFNSMLAMIVKHPISMGSILMIQSSMTLILSMTLTKNSWYSMILFITFSGGIMVMFSYMSSIASNEKFKFSIKMSMLIFMLFLINMFMLYDKTLLFNTNWMETSIFIQENEEIMSIKQSLSNNKKMMLITMMMIILMILISISNIINSFEGPLKKY
uniref:NADH dehydrogenase subunit 6 n=1 Tax=Oliarus cf. filicicola HI01081 TaxID=2879485 RepID=A0A8K1HZK5_9HEMI|nr:NADH dehydrogenase subunit 6 [Oliarus cf. filicicola HI01081]